MQSQKLKNLWINFQSELIGKTLAALYKLQSLYSTNEADGSNQESQPTEEGTKCPSI